MVIAGLTIGYNCALIIRRERFEKGQIQAWIKLQGFDESRRVIFVIIIAKKYFSRIASG